MASHFTPKHISSFGLLERIHPQILFRFLQRYHDFFATKGVMPSTPAAIDHERLSGILAFPNEKMPAPLMADLFYWDEVASMAPIEDLLEVAEKHGLAFSDEITIEEAALLVRMKAPEDLEDLHAVYHAHGLLRKKRRFLSYFARVAKLPLWRNPPAKARKCFEQAMDAWYEPRKKGRGTRLSVIEKDDAVWFIVRHGGTFQRENALEEGEPIMVFFRPEAFDLLIYYSAKGELAIYNDSRSDKERRAYCTNLGTHLFGDAKFFESGNTPKYTLEPLRMRGRAALDCKDVPGVRSARLRYLRYRFHGDNDHCVTHKARDVFTGLEDLDLAIPEDAELLCMGLALTPDNGVGGERMVKLYAPNVSVYDHEADTEITHRFLSLRGFLIARNGRGAGHP